jgi:hypothetical protein
MRYSFKDLDVRNTMVKNKCIVLPPRIPNVGGEIQQNSTTATLFKHAALHTSQLERKYIHFTHVDLYQEINPLTLKKLIMRSKTSATPKMLRDLRVLGPAQDSVTIYLF